MLNTVYFILPILVISADASNCYSPSLRCILIDDSPTRFPLCQGQLVSPWRGNLLTTNGDLVPPFSGWWMMWTSKIRKGETIKLLAKATLAERIFHRLIIHVFGPHWLVLHSTADPVMKTLTRNSQVVGKNGGTIKHICLHCVIRVSTTG